MQFGTPEETKTPAAIRYSQAKHTNSILSELCSSLRSSKVKLASVASELEYNNENVTVEETSICEDLVEIQLP